MLKDVVQELGEGISDGTIERIIKEVNKYALKEIEPVVMIQKLLAK
jgi:hypothetical protein